MNATLNAYCKHPLYVLFGYHRWRNGRTGSVNCRAIRGVGRTRNMREHYHKGTQSIGRRGRLHSALTAVFMIVILRNVARFSGPQTILIGDNSGYFRSVL